MMRPYSPDSRFPRTQFSAQAATLRVLAAGVLAALLGLALFAADVAHAQARVPVARFDGGIGVQPATWAGANAAAPTGGAAAANDVSPCPVVTATCANTPPAGRPWVIADLKATILGDGTFEVNGKGLLLGGGGNVGLTNNASVRMRLYCGVGAATESFTSEESVPLEPDGDFRLRGQLGVVNAPLACPNARLLILNAGASAQAPGGWFAAGIPKL